MASRRIQSLRGRNIAGSFFEELLLGVIIFTCTNKSRILFNIACTGHGMCGIAGIINTDRSKIEGSQIREAIRIQRERGMAAWRKLLSARRRLTDDGVAKNLRDCSGGFLE